MVQRGDGGLHEGYLDLGVVGGVQRQRDRKDVQPMEKPKYKTC